MRNKIYVAIVATLLSQAMPVGATDKNGAYKTYAPSCGTVVNRYAPDGKGGYTLWLEGYMTAFNRSTPDTADILGNSDRESAILWIVNYCKANPLESLADAASALMSELYPKRHRTKQDATQ